MIRSFAEVTSQSQIPKRLLETVDRKTYLMFLTQDNRRFVPALTIGGEGYFSLILTDRQGQIRMSPVTLFGPGKDVALMVLRILAFLMYAPPSDISLNPTVNGEPNTPEGSLLNIMSQSLQGLDLVLESPVKSGFSAPKALTGL